MSGGTRKFAKVLSRPGTAKNRRESATHAIRESCYSSGSELIKSSLSDPIDYEVQVLRKQGEIVSDPHRNLLEFPSDDFQATQAPQDRRTVIDSVPSGADKEVSSLMVKECIKTYQNNWHLIVNKYEDFAGNYLKLPKHGEKKPQLKDVVYEVDEQAEHEEESVQNNSMKEGVTKRGWLHKAPSYTGTSISIRAFKRRYFDLKQMPDNSYILNYYKDEKTSRDPKGAIYLDSCIGAHLTTKARKYAFEIRMQDQSVHLVAADSESDAQEWISTINQALQSTILDQLQNEEQKNGNMTAHQGSEPIKPSNTMESLKSSMHPELVKYSKETDQKNALARKEGRMNLIHMYPDFQERYLKVPTHQLSLPPPPIKQVKHRVMVQCKTISFNLRGVVIDGADEPKTAIEPFFVTLCLYDVSSSQMRKISSDIHVDLNHDLVRRMIPGRDPKKSPSGSEKSDKPESRTGEPSLAPMVKSLWVAYPKNCVFNVSRPHPDIYLVVRIEKVLQGSIKSCAQPYMKADGDTAKTATKVLKHAKLSCQRLGQYRMPFAWTAKPLFADTDGTIDRTPFGDYVYKQESSKLSEEHLLKYLTDFRKPDKLTKLEDIPCILAAEFTSVPSDVTSLLSPSLAPIKPFSEKVDALFEVDEFLPKTLQDQHMHMEYFNNYFIYPRSLKYDSQKSFTKARNIAVVIEFKDSDAEGAVPLCSFYNRPGKDIFTKRLSAAVLHHDETPEFYEEFKLALPPQLHSEHHLLFSFYHVIVDTSGKKKDIIKSEIGHAWLPLLTKAGQVWCDENTLPVSTNLPAGYLSQPDSASYPRVQHAAPELKWVDGGKPLFRLSTRLVSSAYTTDLHLHNFFGCCQQSLAGTASDQDLVKYLKSLLAAEDRALIQFLPTLLNQLFRLLASRNSTRDVKSNCIKSLVHIVTVCHKTDNHKNLLKQYIKYMFVTEPWQDYKSLTVHEELVTSMTELLRPSVTDFLTMNKILKHMSFFLEVVAKSMAQHLIMSEKVKQKRNERFPVSFQHAIQSLLTTTVPHITGKWKNNYEEACNANQSIAHFVKSCFTYVDRGFVFKLINHYMENFNPNDPKVLFEFKFEFLRVVCNHEHYIPLNLPFAAQAKKSKTDYAYSLSEEYCKNHFLAGHLLQSLNAAMYEPQEIRSIAIDTVKNLIAKHVFDSRYETPGHQSRIAALYLPFLRIVLDNAGRFSQESDNSYSSRDDLESTPSKGDNGVPLPPQIDRLTGGSLRMTKPPDINMLSAISSPGLLTKGSRGSLAPSELQATAALDKVVEKNHSLTSATRFTSSERYDISEARSLLICFLHIVKNIPSDALKGFWSQSTTEEQIEFFDIIEVCVYLFRYSGRRQQLQNMRFGSVSKKSSKSMTLPVRIRPGTSHQYKHISILAEPMVTQTPAFVNEQDAVQNSLLEANLASEVGMVVLDVLGDFTRHFKKYLQKDDGDNALMQRVSSVFLLFLQISQSESVLKHAFASLRLFMCKFQSALFRGKADLCASLIYHALKCCNSPLSSTRAEACALLYLLMRTNFEFLSGKNFVRSHLQMIKAVSQLISEEVGIGNSRFQNSLSEINAYAQSDKGMQHSVFHIEVKDLTKKIRTVLMATAAMKEHKDDPEMLVDLQYSLAKSYSATPELRKTWLESMGRVHEKNKNYSEAAMCYIHVAALIAEYLKRKGVINKGCSAFRSISPNVEKEESAIKEDHGMQDVQYNEVVLTELLRRCVAVLETAERYELMASVYRMIIPFYEKNRDFMGLAEIYGTLKDANVKVANVNQSGKRLLGTYFRVAFYGQQYFEEEDGKEYIYKEPKLTQLSEISMRLQQMYGAKFGHDNVKLIQESNKVNRKDLDPKYAYVQVTYVKPYFDEQELEQRVTYFERAHNVKNFVFETPFTPGGKARGGIEEQWKRKTILTTAHSFPYVKKRILVTSQRSFELKPIEVALDEMESKCAELDELVCSRTIDLKKLQLRLQGSVSVTVNAGPLAYAKAFLEDSKISSHPANTVDRLRKVFRRFVGLCGQALEINDQLIMSDQREYHENLKKCYEIMADELSHIMHEQLIGDDDDTISLTASSMGEVESVFSSISSPPSAPGSLAKRTSTANIRPMSSAGLGPRKSVQGVVSDVSDV